MEVVTDSNPIKKLKITQGMQFLPGLQTVWCFGHAYFCDQVACRLIVGFLFKGALYTEYSLHSFKGNNQPNKQSPKTTPKTWRGTFPSWLTAFIWAEHKWKILEITFLKHCLHCKCSNLLCLVCLILVFVKHLICRGLLEVWKCHCFDLQ